MINNKILKITTTTATKNGGRRWDGVGRRQWYTKVLLFLHILLSHVPCMFVLVCVFASLIYRNPMETLYLVHINVWSNIFMHFFGLARCYGLHWTKTIFHFCYKNNYIIIRSLLIYSLITTLQVRPISLAVFSCSHINGFEQQDNSAPVCLWCGLKGAMPQQVCF